MKFNLKKLSLRTVSGVAIGLLIVGGLINVWSVYGMNGHMGSWQTQKHWPVVVGWIIMVPGALVIAAIMIIALKNWIFKKK